MHNRRTSVQFDVPLSPPRSTLPERPNDHALQLEQSLSAAPLSPSPNNSPTAGFGLKLIREQTKRDPLFYYETLSVLGVGSMGSVTKVRKRDSVIGGSARPDLQKYFRTEKRFHACFEIPFVGSFFRHCLKFKEKELMENVHSGDLTTGKSLSDRSAASTTSSNSSRRKEKLYAMKSIHLSRIEDKTFVKELLNEVDVLKKLDHPHIVKPIETFHYRNQCFIVMELCTGGDLYSRDPYTEEEAARITRQIVSAISYMHDRNILHRDIKYENILFVNNDPKAEVKLIDFGLSKAFIGEQLSEGVGTIYSMAPEVILGSYSQKADLWSIGCVCYMLLSSQMPFYGRSRKQIVEKILAGKVAFNGRRWKKISPLAKEFVSSLLILDETDRATAEEAFASPWLHRRLAATIRSPHEHEIDKTMTSIAKYANYARLKKIALMVIAHKSTSEEIGILRKVFEQYDVKRKGALTYNEFKAAFDAAGYPEEDCRRIFDATDIDRSGRIRYTEFLAATIEAHGAISEERLAEAFDRLDSDDSGYISVKNLRDVLGKDIPLEELDVIIKEADLSNDNRISYPEFLAMWQDKQEILRDKIIREMEDIEGRCNQSFTSTSPLSDDDLIAKANFIEGKIAVRRKSMNHPTMPPELLGNSDPFSSRSVETLMETMTVDSYDHLKVADV